MKLNGKEVRVLLGALTIFLDVPFNKTQKRKINEDEEKLIEDLIDGLMVLAENEYAKNIDINEEYNKKIAKRLEIRVEYNFKEIEFELSKEAIAVCIDEDCEEASHNVYFGGDEYGINIKDFKNLLQRMKNLTTQGASVT